MYQLELAKLELKRWQSSERINKIKKNRVKIQWREDYVSGGLSVPTFETVFPNVQFLNIEVYFSLKNTKSTNFKLYTSVPHYFISRLM